MNTSIRILISIAGIVIFASFLPVQEDKKVEIKAEDLKIACDVLCKLTDRTDSKYHLAIYYNAYKAITEGSKMQHVCDEYFEEIKTSFSNDIGIWSVSLDFPPKQSNPSSSGGFTHKQIETLDKLQNLNLTIEDLEEFALLKRLQNNVVDPRLLKTIKLEDIQQLNENLNELDMKNLNSSKLNNLPNEQINIEDFQNVLNR